MGNNLCYQEEKKNAVGYLQYKERIGKLDKVLENNNNKKERVI